MGDARFERPYDEIRHAVDRAYAVRGLADEAVVEALAAASREKDPLLANVLATEALNRMRRLRAALVNLGEGVVALGVDGDIHWMNPAAERLLRVERGPAMFEAFEEVVEHLDAKKVTVPKEVCPIMRALVGERGTGDGEWFRLRDGSELCVSYTAAPILGEDGDLEGAVVAFQDCGARKRAERALRESRERYKSLFDHSPQGIISVALDGTVLAFNEAAEAITERPYEESEGRPFTQFLHPEDAPRVMDLFAKVSRGDRGSTTLRILHRNGRYVKVEATGVPVIVDGEVVGLHGLVRAIE